MTLLVEYSPCRHKKLNFIFRTHITRKYYSDAYMLSTGTDVSLATLTTLASSRPLRDPHPRKKGKQCLRNDPEG